MGALWSFVFTVAVIGSYVVNVVKLSDCDFEAPYKCEVIHGVGITTPAFLLTAWIDVE